MLSLDGRPVGRALGTCLILGGLISGTAAELRGQLRPYEPIEWAIFDGGRTGVVDGGVVYLTNQKASLAGVEGDLWAIGTFNATVRSGRIGITVAGTPYRTLRNTVPFGAPYGGAVASSANIRSDVGDFLLSTTVRLSPDESRTLAALRFGTRLPTTDNRVGLERDRTDFFATLGIRRDLGALRIESEFGVGIHGTREAEYEQSDVLVGTGKLSMPGLPLQPAILVVGHADGLADRSIRGNEELLEVRFLLQTSGQTWLRAEAIVGSADFSPSWGTALRIGRYW